MEQREKVNRRGLGCNHHQHSKHYQLPFQSRRINHCIFKIYIDNFDTLDEKLAEALTDGAAKWAPGIEIISIRVTKPKIPDNLLRNYEQIEAQKTQLQIA